MKESKKNAKNDIIIKNLKGFIRMGADVAVKGFIPTGHFNLDFAICFGRSPESVDLSVLEGYDASKPSGLPLGKVVEIFGEEGGGKSSLAMRICGAAQKMKLKCAWVDTENSFQPNLAKINGCDPSALYYSDMSNPENQEIVFYAEHIFDAIVQMCKDGVKVIVVDSVANMVPKVRMEADAEKQTMGVIPRIISENMGKVVNHASKYGVLVIFINQLREKIGVMYGNPETTPGGRSLKHNASVRLRVAKAGGGDDSNIYVNDDNGNKVLVGRKANVKIVKNRMAKPFLEPVEVIIYYEAVALNIEDILFNEGRKLKVITVRKGVFSWGNLKVEGQKELIEKIKLEKLQEKLYNDIKIAAEAEKSLLPPEIKAWVLNKDKKIEDIDVDDLVEEDDSDTDGTEEDPDGDIEEIEDTEEDTE